MILRTDAPKFGDHFDDRIPTRRHSSEAGAEGRSGRSHRPHQVGVLLHWNDLEPKLVDGAIEMEQFAEKRPLCLCSTLGRARQRHVVDRPFEACNEHRSKFPLWRAEMNFAFAKMQAFRVKSKD
jgi:hypothetical protein